MKKQAIRILPILVLMVSALFGCGEDDLDPVIPDEDGDNDIEVVDYLLFTNAQKVIGKLPEKASETKIQLNVKDTIFLMEGDPYMARLAMLHDPSLVLSGFNVGIKGLENDYYYFVPSDELDNADSVSVIYMGIVQDQMDQPVVEVKIQPVDEANVPITTIEIPVMPQNPSSPEVKALTDPHPGTNDPGGIWKWVYTNHYEYQRDIIRQFLAPKQNLPHSPGPLFYPGCCVDGVSVRVGEAMGMYGICADTSALYKRIPYVPSYSHIGFDFLFLNPVSFHHYVSSYIFNFDPTESDMCTVSPAYQNSTTVYTRSGTHNYSKGSSSINFTRTFNDPPFGPAMPFGNIKYTDNILVFSINIEGSLTRVVYQRWDGVVDIVDIENQVFDWFDH